MRWVGWGLQPTRERERERGGGGGGGREEREERGDRRVVLPYHVDAIHNYLITI